MQMIYELHQVNEVADKLLALRNECAVFTFTGSLGAGKTTLIRTMFGKLAIDEPITSPTFTYVNRYANNKGEVFYHFDLYRIATVQDFIQAGFDEYLFAENSWSFIEWPEVITPLLVKGVCQISLEYIDADKRLITWTIIK